MRRLLNPPKEGTIRNKLIILWNNATCSVYGKRTETFKVSSEDGAQRVVNNRTARNIEGVIYYDAKGEATKITPQKQEVFHMGYKKK